jgi:hypothetical protein
MCKINLDEGLPLEDNVEDVESPQQNEGCTKVLMESLFTKATTPLNTRCLAQACCYPSYCCLI